MDQCLQRYSELKMLEGGVGNPASFMHLLYYKKPDLMRERREQLANIN